MASPFIELEVGERLVKVTNPDKPLFPQRGYTKRDLVDYYLSVGDGIVRALRERPTQLRRFPDGIEGEQIYQKRVPEKRPDWVEAARVTFPVGPACRRALRDRGRPGRLGGEPGDDRLSPMAVAQARHRASGRAADRHRPAARNRVRATGKSSRRSSARCLPRSGSRAGRRPPGNRGIHVACRIEPLWEFPVVRRCALAFAREIERRAPDLVTTAWWKEERGEKVFIDYNQNARDRTIASAYSVRPRPDATVSAPVTWDELPDIETEDFTLVSMPDRFAAPRRSPGRHRRRRLRSQRAARLGRARRSGGRRGGAVPAELPEDARRAAAGAALPPQEGRAGVGSGGQRLGSALRCDSRSPIVGPLGSRGGRNSSHVHAAGSLSGRKRRSFVPWRNRLPCTLS